MHTSSRGTALIIGAGPAGLTAAREFQKRTGITPIVLESSLEIGGLSRTVRHNGHRMDIGGHRFFSKSDRVMSWWLEQMPLESPTETGNLVMLTRQRKSRIYFLRSFFDYPITISAATIANLGIARTVRCGLSFLRAAITPKRKERSLEDFFINRFGHELYTTFFRSYTEKVWGVPCSEISSQWGAQRVKSLSLASALAHFLKSRTRTAQTGIEQKGTETSLIERFLYPKFGPGQLWEHVASQIVRDGGQLLTGWTVTRLHSDGSRIISADAVNSEGVSRNFTADYFVSSMPVPDLISALADAGRAVPGDVLEVAAGLAYRDFITVGLLVDQLAIAEPDGGRLKDTWLYIQEPDVLLGRLQIFNNWSPYLTTSDKLWLGLEYFCKENDSLWSMSDSELASFAHQELQSIGLLHNSPILDSHVVRVPKTYPAYFGTYDRFSTVKDYTELFSNLFLVGRNGMHRYNNQDHSMLTAMQVVNNICQGVESKENIWSINTEQDYHEEKGQQQGQNSQKIEEPTTAYDYSNQAWIENGKYVSCGHLKPCTCFGTQHQGEPFQQKAEIQPTL